MKHLTAALIALWLVLGATTHAHAEPISTAIGLTALITGLGASAAVAGAIGGALVMMTVGLGLNLLTGALFRKRGSADVGGTTGKMQTGGVVPRSFPFGEKAPVTHSLVYWNSFGQDGKTPNAYVAFVFALSDLPIGGGRAALSELWVNGSKVTWNPAATPGTYGIAISEFNKDGRDHMWVEVHDGTQTTADTFMVSQFSGDANWPYENTRIGTGVAYVRVICRLNRDLFSGYPTFKFVCKGIPFYDVREDTTAGGSGSHRWSTQSTWENTENPITVAYNLIRGVSYDGTWFFGGQTASAAQVPFAAFAAAMNECDATITNEDDTTEKQFRCAGEIRLDMEPADVIDDLLRACNGQIGETGGVYKPYVGAAGVAVLSITDDDIRTDEDQTFEPFFGLQDIVNSINAKYVEPGEGWTAKDAPALIDEDLEAIDGGRRQPVDLQFEYVPFARQVQRQCRAALTDYRRERRHALPLAPEAWRLEPAIDFVSWTSERNGYTAKLFAVTGVTDMDGYLAGVSLKEVDPGDYDDVTSIAPTINVPPLVYPPSQGIAGADIDGVTVEGSSGRSKAGALLQWNGSELDDVRAVAFQIRVDGETDLTYEGETPESAVAAGTYIVTANLNGDTDYEGRMRFVPFTGRETTWSDWIEFTTPDVRVNWNELEAATQAGLAAVNDRLQAARDLIEQLSAQAQALEQQVLSNQATVVRDIVSTQGQAEARLLETYTVLAAADTAIAATVTSLSAQVNDATTGLPATRATLIDFQSTQATLNTAVATDITSLNASLTSLSGTVSGQATAIGVLDARVTSVEGVNTSQGTAITSLTSNLSTANSNISANASAISTLNTSVTSINGTLGSQATAITALQADYNDISAGGDISMVSVAAESGYSAYYQVRIFAGGTTAAMRFTVTSGGLSGIDFIADRTRFIATDGTTFATFDGTTKTLNVDRIASGTATLYKEFTRAEPGSDGAVGSGTTASGAGNSYIDSASLGSLTVPANPNAIGDGAAGSDYCPVLFAINATARNNSFGWGFGSALPMVVAFRAKLDDGAGNVFYSDEGLIACSSSWNGSAVYGFGGNPGSITDIAQVKAGTYNVYLQYRWGPRTENGMAANPSAPNGLPLRIAAKIVALILKK